MPVAKKS
jgi:hypothetical protein